MDNESRVTGWWVFAGILLAIAASSGRMSSLGISIMQTADGSAPKSLPCVPAPPRDAP